MSLSFQPLTPVCVQDPRIKLESYHTFPVLKCGQQTTFKAFTTTSVSSSGIQFSCPPPSSNIIVDRNVYLYIPVRLTFTGIPAVGDTLLNASNDAPRAYPIASSIDNLSATINNQNVTLNSADIIQAMVRYNTGNHMKALAHSMTPTYLDQSQNYNDLALSVRNPLGLYQDGLDSVQPQRGSFPYTIVSNPVQAVLGTVLTATVDVAFCEPLFLSPFTSGSESQAGFINVSTIDVNINFVNQIANRMWSHNGSGAGRVPFLSSNAVFGGLSGGPTTTFPGGNQCSLLFTYITPQETMVIPRHIPVSYPYANTIYFASDLPQSTNANPTTYNSNSIQLNSIPMRVYIYVRERNQDLWSSASNTDTYFQITSLTINFLNSSGLLASASYNQLYDISRKNGCQLSFTQFGGGINNSNFSAQIGAVGSVIALDFSKDIGLSSLLAPGILNQSMLQVQCTAINISGRTINPTLYVVTSQIGTFTVQGPGQSSVSLGVLTPNDVLDCERNGTLNYNDVYDKSFQGGDFWQSIKDFGAKLMPYLSKAHDFLKDNKVLSKAAKYIPTVGPYASTALDVIGYGQGGVMAGSQGGATLHRKQLHKRLAQY